MMQKRPLDLRRLRARPPRGFGWLDHRLLRHGYLARCTAQAVALYCLLVCAGDGQGLSFYSEPSLCRSLQLPPEALRRARAELLALGLIAYQKPLYQVLALGAEEPSAPPRGEALATPPAVRLAAPASRPPAAPQAARGPALDLRAMVRAALEKGGLA